MKWVLVTLSLPRVINFKFRLQPPQKYNITQYGELDFSSITQMNNMIILPTLTASLIHFSLKGWENVLFDLWGERVNLIRGALFIPALPVISFRKWPFSGQHNPWLSHSLVAFHRSALVGSRSAVFVPGSTRIRCSSPRPDVLLWPVSTGSLSALFTRLSVHACEHALCVPEVTSPLALVPRYASVLSHYAAVSFGDSLFARFLVLPLAQRYHPRFRRALWDEHVEALRALSLRPQQVSSNREPFRFLAGTYLWRVPLEKPFLLCNFCYGPAKWKFHLAKFRVKLFGFRVENSWHILAITE